MVFCIVDNGLKNFAGHHFQYIQSFIGPLRERKIPHLVLANRKALPEFDRFFPVERIFRRSHYEWPCRIRKIGFFVNLWILNYSFYRDLRQALRGRTDNNWLVFAPNVNHMELFAWERWIRNIPDERRPRVRLFMRWSYFQKEKPDQRERYTFVAQFALRRLERFSSVRLVTDSDSLANEYRTLTSLPVDILPIPHTEMASLAETPCPHQKPCVVFLGGARSEKGFPLLAKAAYQIAQRHIKLIVQCNLDGPDDEAAAARLELDQLEGPEIQLIKEPLSSAGYYELLAKADIVVLPYRQQNYRTRTSGILVEALAAGKPIVVTAGTWMAAQVVPKKVGITFEDGDTADLLRAIEDVAASLNEYRERALAFRKEWLAFHNPSRAVKSLLA